MSAQQNVEVEQPLSKKITLKVKTTASLPFPVDTQSTISSKDGSSSPPRPSYSPVTPTLSSTKLTMQDQGSSSMPISEPQWMNEPEPLPVSLDENSDAIALRATISILQMQRQRALKDIRDLDKLRDMAIDDPDGFVSELKAGKLAEQQDNDISSDDEGDNTELPDGDRLKLEMKQDAPNRSTNKKFRPLPNPQNVARCPPIEWEKYHVVGQSLDKLHELQKKHPGVSAFDFARLKQEDDILNPYRPFQEKMVHP